MDTINYPITDPYNTVLVQYVPNGLILTKFVTLEGQNETKFEPVTYVFEAKKKWGLAGHDTETLVEFLWGILEALEIYFSKHDEETIEIKVIRRYEDGLEGCGEESD